MLEDHRHIIKIKQQRVLGPQRGEMVLKSIFLHCDAVVDTEVDPCWIAANAKAKLSGYNVTFNRKMNLCDNIKPVILLGKNEGYSGHATKTKLTLDWWNPKKKWFGMAVQVSKLPKCLCQPILCLSFRNQSETHTNARVITVSHSETKVKLIPMQESSVSDKSWLKKHKFV